MIGDQSKALQRWHPFHCNNIKFKSSCNKFLCDVRRSSTVRILVCEDMIDCSYFHSVHRWRSGTVHKDFEWPATLHFTVQCSTVQCSNVQYWSTLHCITSLYSIAHSLTHRGDEAFESREPTLQHAQEVTWFKSAQKHGFPKGGDEGTPVGLNRICWRMHSCLQVRL